MAVTHYKLGDYSEGAPGGPRYAYRATVSDGDEHHIRAIPSYRKIKVHAIPGTGATTTVDLSCSSDANILAESANWLDWGNGDITPASEETAKQKALEPGHTGIKITSTSGDTVVEVVAA